MESSRSSSSKNADAEAEADAESADAEALAQICLGISRTKDEPATPSKLPIGALRMKTEPTTPTRTKDEPTVPAKLPIGAFGHGRGADDAQQMVCGGDGSVHVGVADFCLFIIIRVLRNFTLQISAF